MASNSPQFWKRWTAARDTGPRLQPRAGGAMVDRKEELDPPAAPGLVGAGKTQGGEALGVSGLAPTPPSHGAARSIQIGMAPTSGSGMIPRCIERRLQASGGTSHGPGRAEADVRGEAGDQTQLTSLPSFPTHSC